MAGHHSLRLSMIPILTLLSSIGCRPMDYFLLHPLQPQPGIIRESEFFDRGQLELHASTWEETLTTLRRASPIHHVERIEAPVLLVHGEKDRTAPLEQVRRLWSQFESAGKKCELLVVPGAGHVFNFRDEDRGKIAWEKTMEFLERHLKKR